jgi:hypothetical protein
MSSEGMERWQKHGQRANAREMKYSHFEFPPRELKLWKIPFPSASMNSNRTKVRRPPIASFSGAFSYRWRNKITWDRRCQLIFMMRKQDRLFQTAGSSGLRRLFPINLCKVAPGFEKIRIQAKRLFKVHFRFVFPAGFQKSLTQTVLHQRLKRIDLQ